MAIGWGVAAGVIARIIDTLWPSKKAAIVDRLNELIAQYHKALEEGRDTDAAVIRKQVSELRKKVGFCDSEI